MHLYVKSATVWQGYPAKNRIPGAKYHFIGVTSHEKHPAERVLK